MSQSIVDQLVAGARAQATSERLERALEKVLERLRKVRATGQSKVDLEIAIMEADITLKTIKELRSSY